MKMNMHLVLAALAVSTGSASFLAKVEPTISSPKMSVPQVPQAAVAIAVHQEPVAASVQDHAGAAQKSAAEAQHHLEQAQQAYNMTKSNVKEIHATGKKIEGTADKIKDMYGAGDKEKDEAKKVEAEAKDATEAMAPEDAEIGKAMDLSNPQQKEAGNGQFYRTIAQLIFALLYYVMIVKHYPEARELPPPNDEARELQSVNEVSATCHASMPNLCLAWCCSGPRAAHTFYSTLGFNYWTGCVLTSFLPCCTLWYFNSFTKLNEKLGGEKRSAFMGLFCACLCSCCVIAQDAEALDRITGYETGLCGVTRRSK